MKKKILILLTLLFLFSSSNLFANPNNPDFKAQLSENENYEKYLSGVNNEKFIVTGKMEVTNEVWKNETIQEKEKSAIRKFISQDIDLNFKFNVDDISSFIVKTSMHSENWGNREGLSGNEDDDGLYTKDDISKDNFSIDRAYMSHSFYEGTLLELGLMDAGIWATSFGDTEKPSYKIKLAKNLWNTKYIGIYQKDIEAGEAEKVASDKDDKTTMQFGIIKDFNGIIISPLFTYTLNGYAGQSNNQYKEDDLSKARMDLGISSESEYFGFESEFIYEKYMYSSTLKAQGDIQDYELYGLYAKAYVKYYNSKIGLIATKGSYEHSIGGNEKVFSFGEDFDLTYFLSKKGFGQITNDREGLAGVLGFQLFGDFEIAPQRLNLFTSVSHISCLHDKEGTTHNYKDSSAVEIDAKITYHITSNFNIAFEGAYVHFDIPNKEIDNTYYMASSFNLNF